jgi:hypothetical protein
LKKSSTEHIKIWSSDIAQALLKALLRQRATLKQAQADKLFCRLRLNLLADW